nr:MGMT family protein [Candidatus Gracilibacteria bacterium]
MDIDKQILAFIQTIPKGKVSTYKLIGDKFCLHPRAVASVMRKNKKPEIYPCYKVIAHSGKISGYTPEGGVSEKIKKLEKDGIEIINGKVDKKYFFI